MDYADAAVLVGKAQDGDRAAMQEAPRRSGVQSAIGVEEVR